MVLSLNTGTPILTLTTGTPNPIDPKPYSTILRNPYQLLVGLKCANAMSAVQGGYFFWGGLRGGAYKKDYSIWGPPIFSGGDQCLRESPELAEGVVSLLTFWILLYGALQLWDFYC